MTKPLVKCFCKKGYTINTGKVATKIWAARVVWSEISRIVIKSLEVIVLASYAVIAFCKKLCKG